MVVDSIIIIILFCRQNKGKCWKTKAFDDENVLLELNNMHKCEVQKTKDRGRAVLVG